MWRHRLEQGVRPSVPGVRLTTHLGERGVVLDVLVAPVCWCWAGWAWSFQRHRVDATNVPPGSVQCGHAIPPWIAVVYWGGRCINIRGKSIQSFHARSFCSCVSAWRIEVKFIVIACLILPRMKLGGLWNPRCFCCSVVWRSTSSRESQASRYSLGTVCAGVVAALLAGAGVAGASWCPISVCGTPRGTGSSAAGGGELLVVALSVSVELVVEELSWDEVVESLPGVFSLAAAGLAFIVMSACWGCSAGRPGGCLQRSARLAAVDACLSPRKC